MMKRSALILCLLSAAFTGAFAQKSADAYAGQYERLVARVGVAGLGVKTVLDQWERDYPDDARMLHGAFRYHYAQCHTSGVVQRTTPRYLGRNPLFSLNDTTRHAKVYYFEDDVFDEAVFKQALSYADKAIATSPDRLDFRLRKAAALLAYEKENPDKSASFLSDLVIYHGSVHPTWEMPGVTADDAFFRESIQEYCFALFRIATPVSYEAFRTLSDNLLKFYPKETMFLDNMGSYYLVAKSDIPSALKWYDKALKIKKSDMTAIQNGILAGRSTKDVKLEKKYLKQMARYGSDLQKKQAVARLEQLSAKKR